MTKEKVVLSICESFSRLVIERATNSYGDQVIWLRWGGANCPVIEVKYDEARSIADAILQVMQR